MLQGSPFSAGVCIVLVITVLQYGGWGGNNVPDQAEIPLVNGRNTGGCEPFCNGNHHIGQ